MWSALLRKELRQVLPWTLLLYGFTCISWLVLLVFEPDTVSWASGTALCDPSVAQVWSAALLLFAVMFAYSGFPREYDDGTSTFLVSLPVTRARLFVAKVGAAGLLLTGLVALGELTRWLSCVANPTSFDGHNFRLDWALTNLFLGVWAAWIHLGYATFLAAFRRFGLLLGFLALTLLTLVAHKHPGYRQLNPIEMLRIEFFDTRPLLPWKALLGHSVVATTLAALAGFVWLGPVESFASRVARSLAKAWVRWAFGLCAFASVFAALVHFYTPEDEAEVFGSPAELTGADERLATLRYEFRFKSTLRTRVQRLAQDADAMHDSLSEALAAPTSDPIQVNLLKPSQFHAGSATWNAIRMHSSALYDDGLLARTLVHETSHVLALRASDRRLETFATTLRFFDEGLAEHMALSPASDSQRAQALWLEAALLRQRERVEVAQLTDLPLFVRRFGEPSIYPLGYTWVQALLTTCGSDAPRRVLAALKRSELPSDLAGESLLRSALQLAKCDASQVNSTWARSIDAVSTERKAEVEAVPELIGNLMANADDGEVAVRAELRGKPLPEAFYRVNVRGSADDGLDLQATVSAEPDANGHLEFLVPEDYLTDGSADIQFAVAWEREGVLYQHAQEWRHVRLTPQRL